MNKCNDSDTVRDQGTQWRTAEGESSVSTNLPSRDPVSAQDQPVDGLRIVVGSDDAGADYRKLFSEELRHDPRVQGVIEVEMADGEHYPDVAVLAASLVADGHADRALLFCGTGLGVAMSANKVHGIRAVTAHDSYSVERSVLSNNAQVLCMGQRVIGIELARRLIREWLDYRFDPNSHSAVNVDALAKYDH